MSVSRIGSGVRGILAAGLIAGFGFAAEAQSGSEGPFLGLSGSWSGTGTVTVKNGSSERIRCRATYSVTPSGETLRQDLRCASDSYKFEVKASVIASSGGALSGTWTETTRQVTGAVSGSITPGSISIVVKGGVFSANLSVETRGNSQAVSIRPEGTDITGIRIDMKRA